MPAAASSSSSPAAPLSGTPTPTGLAHPRPLPTGAAKYRGACVEDLQLPPAFTLPATAPVRLAISEAYERDFSHVPVLGRGRRVLGYVSVGRLKGMWERGEVDADARISTYTTRFPLSPPKPYRLITPQTPLEELEAFLSPSPSQSPASSSGPAAQQGEGGGGGEEFALVTDSERKFVLGVATSADLQNFISRRGF